MLLMAGGRNQQIFGSWRVVVASLMLACVSFLIGIWIALPRNTPWRQIVVSYLMSTTHNPQGHLYAASGLVICTCFLVPVGGRFRYAFPRTRITFWGIIFFVIGVGTLAFDGALSFVTDNLGNFHDDITAISLFGILTSMMLYLSHVVSTVRGKVRAVAAAMTLSLLAIFAMLFHVFWNPDFISSDAGISVWHALAAWEWSVISYIAVCLFMLILFSTQYRK